MNPRLYGIINSTREGKQHFSKNCFNSSFPVALALYMADTGRNAVCLSAENGTITGSEKPWPEIFGVGSIDHQELFWDFEKKYSPYEKLVFGGLPSVDVVLRGGPDRENSHEIRPFEIKLTVVPDATTSSKEDTHWGSEIVIRPQTIKYCAISIAANNDHLLQRVSEILNPICQQIKSWESDSDVRAPLDSFCDAMLDVLSMASARQTPLLMNPIWKTIGDSSMLEDNAFDFFVWNDFALAMLAIKQAGKSGKKISRPQRAVIQLARSLNELSTKRNFNINTLFDTMSYSNQSDKSFSVSGNVTNQYYPSTYVLDPRIEKSELVKIILADGHKYLKPERRFDATIFFQTAELFDEF